MNHCTSNSFTVIAKQKLELPSPAVVMDSTWGSSIMVGVFRFYVKVLLQLIPKINSSFTQHGTELVPCLTWVGPTATTLCRQKIEAQHTNALTLDLSVPLHLCRTNLKRNDGEMLN